VNAVSETYNRRPKAITHADRVAQALALDMAAVGWRPTLDNYLGRVTKGRILQAVSEAKGGTAAERIRALKKAEMAKAAEDLLIGTGWLPEPLRTPGQTFAPGIESASSADAELEAQSAENGGESAMDESATAPQTLEPPAATAAVAAE
jgi:ParB family chromosome partitioning protein